MWNNSREPSSCVPCLPDGSRFLTLLYTWCRMLPQKRRQALACPGPISEQQTARFSFFFIIAGGMTRICGHLKILRRAQHRRLLLLPRTIHYFPFIRNTWAMIGPRQEFHKKYSAHEYHPRYFCQICETPLPKKNTHRSRVCIVTRGRMPRLTLSCRTRRSQRGPRLKPGTLPRTSRVHGYDRYRRPPSSIRRPITPTHFPFPRPFR